LTTIKTVSFRYVVIKEQIAKISRIKSIYIFLLLKSGGLLR